MKQNLIFFLPNFSLGGASNSIKNICYKVREKNKKINIIIISIGNNSLKSLFLKKKIKVIEIKYSKTIFAILKIKKILKKFSNEKTTFISNINYANVITCLFLKKNENLKIILTERTPIQELFYYNSIIDFIKKKIIFYLVKITYKKADHIIGNSNAVSKDLSKYTSCKVRTLFPIVEISKTKKIKNKNVNISWVGRNSPEKNIEDFIKALNELDLKKNIKINIITDRFNSNKLSKNLIKKISVQNFKINKKKLINIYKKTDIMVNTSLYEGFPNVIAEAINYYCLIIASKSHGGCIDLIKNGSSGITYRTKDYMSLSKKIDYAINNLNRLQDLKKIAKKNLKLIGTQNENYIHFFKQNNII
jgi:glycosyltransferase involved in cell wall biosynthesis